VKRADEVTSRRSGAFSARLDAGLAVRADRAISELRLALGGLRGLWLIDTRTSTTLSARTLDRDDEASLERIVAAMPDLFQAGVSMELIGGREEAPVELSEVILITDERVATALVDPRSRFGIAAILAPDANIALELHDLRSALGALAGG
jgi:hypothetical protein